MRKLKNNLKLKSSQNLCFFQLRVYNPNGPPSSNNQFTVNNNTAPGQAPKPAFRPQTSFVRPQRQSKYNWVNPALQNTEK